MNEVLPLLLLSVVFCSGLWCVARPESVVRLRQRLGLSNSFMTGGFAYATPSRTRLSGIILLTLSLLLIAGRFLWG